jgi:hypothetical protein
MLQRKTELRRGAANEAQTTADTAPGSGMAEEVEDILFSIECEQKNPNLPRTTTVPDNADKTHKR